MNKKRNMKWRLAVTGIKKNSKIYLPYILAGIGMVAVTYILLDLSISDLMGRMNAGMTLKVILLLGVNVMAIFSLIMLFYTNSFLIKTRTKEFGLYNILGMDKKTIAGILVAETVITGAISIVGGLVLGLLLSKLSEACLARLINQKIQYALNINVLSIALTVLFFALFYVAVMIKNVITISRRNTIELLKEDRMGEKPPKARYFLALIGLVILAAAYYIAVTIKNPISALSYFFIAVVMVIVATMILFIVGSVTLCKLLQKNKRYYYKTRNFVSLSSMSFRMKRNGVGLAGICILSTMVMVMISATSCLYFGKEDNLKEMFPNNVLNEVGFELKSTAEQRNEIKSNIISALRDSAAELDMQMENTVDIEYKGYTCWIDNGTTHLLDNPESDEAKKHSGSTWDVLFVSLDDYNRYMGTNETLADNEVICCEFSKRYPFDSVTYFGNETSYSVKSRTKDFYNLGSYSYEGLPKAVFVTRELPTVKASGTATEGEPAATEQTALQMDLSISWEYGFDISNPDDAGIIADVQALYKNAIDKARDKETSKYAYWQVQDIFSSRDEFFSMYGGLFFIGIALSLVFTCALGLMIYYKQISEGYEDRSRFEIMQKVGMTEKDIRSSVNSQMSSVFYIPLVVAIVHLAFAFPMISRCLKLFGVMNFKPLLITSLISVGIFAIIYTVIYKITSNSYYKLVK